MGAKELAGGRAPAASGFGAAGLPRRGSAPCLMRVGVGKPRNGLAVRVAANQRNVENPDQRSRALSSVGARYVKSGALLQLYVLAVKCKTYWPNSMVTVTPDLSFPCRREGYTAQLPGGIRQF